ncbi:MAG: PqqD family protein [Actinomycetota bacterium]|nr:PqqD family protein [Actinomycetota bacterium]
MLAPAEVKDREGGCMTEDKSMRDTSLLASSVRLPEHVVHRAFAAETVVLNLQTGQYHGLNPVAGRMLGVLENGVTMQDAARQLAAEYGQPLETIEEDICGLCTDLLERGLIETDSAKEG